MIGSVVDPFCEPNPVTGPRDAGPGNFDLVRFLANKLDAVMAFEDDRPDSVIHVPYPDLVADPVDIARSVCAQTGVEFDDAFAGRIEGFLGAQRAGKRAAPPRRIDALGHDHDDVLATPTFARYCSRHDIRPERVRLSG